MYQPSDLMNMLVSGRSLNIQHSLAYGRGPRRTLDVYRPENAADAPIIVFFYGGSWQSGAKKLYRFAATALARCGLVIIVPDYRVYPEVRYPSFLEDAAHAVSWANARAGSFGGNPEKLFVMGHSAGAHIAAMLSFDTRWLNGVGLDPQRDIAGLVGLAGPYDFLPLQDETLRSIFDGDDPSTQPITHVSRGAPPALLATGACDPIVSPANTSRLAAKLASVGTDVTTRFYPRAGHFAIMMAFAPLLRFLAPVIEDTIDFVKQEAPALLGHAGTAAAIS